MGSLLGCVSASPWMALNAKDDLHLKITWTELLFIKIMQSPFQRPLRSLHGQISAHKHHLLRIRPQHLYVMRFHAIGFSPNVAAWTSLFLFNGNLKSNGFVLLNSYNQYQQSRTFVSSIIRGIGHVIKTPLTALGAGTGLAAYANYKLDQFQDHFIPDWLREMISEGKKNMSDGGGWLPDFAALMAGITGLASDDDERGNLEAIKLENKESKPNEKINKKTKEAEIKKDIVMENKEDTNKSNESVGLSLTKKMIEIRNLLREVMPSNEISLRLPGIIVIGSQSSGKSSVLEAIVGHEFLPKGSNMVTRRPIELTLIHIEDNKSDYCEFPQLGLGKITNFTEVRKILTDMNMAVPIEECVSDTPIYLNIYSQNVSDLTLVDLPGYIQVTNANQPPSLKEKIAELCDKYLYQDNIILAVSAADVDLANSEALRAARKADPQGIRTIGILTKMDMVDPEYGVQLINNRNYPLKLGYIGVICKYPKSEGTFFQSTSTSNMLAAKKYEDSIFKNELYDEKRDNIGTNALKKLVERVLEQHIAKSLPKISNVLRDELDDVQYQFKVHYNDRNISAESYVAETRDKLKQKFKDFSEEFGKPQIREEVRKMLDSLLVEICEQQYWSDPLVNTLPRICIGATTPKWKEQLDFSSSALTKSGIGRSTVQIVVDKLMENMERITSTDSWSYHIEGRKLVLDFSKDILKSRMLIATDQVENTIKPYKYDVEILPGEWINGQKRAVNLLDDQIKNVTLELNDLKQQYGRRRLHSVVKYIQRLEDAAIMSVEQGLGSESLGLIPNLQKNKDTSSSINDVNDINNQSIGWWGYIFGSSNNDLNKVSNNSPSIPDTSATSSSPSIPSRTSSPSSSSNSQRTLNSNLRFDKSSEVKQKPIIPWGSNNPKVRSIMEDAFLAVVGTGAINSRLLEAGQSALALQRKSEILKSRLSAVKSRQCSDENNQSCCPEVYLAVVADKLAYTAVMFIGVELLNEFYFEVPKEIDTRFSYHSLGQNGTLEFAKENPNVKHHLQVQQRKEALEKAMDALRELQRINKK